MMMIALHLMVAIHFKIKIISLATVSLLWLGSLANFPPIRTKESLTVLDDCWIRRMKISSLVVNEDRLFMELMHLPKASDHLIWRWTFLVDVLFTVIFFASSFYLLFWSTCLHCATLTEVRYIPEVKSGLEFTSFNFFSLSTIINYFFVSWIGRIICYRKVSYAATQRRMFLAGCRVLPFA